MGTFIDDFADSGCDLRRIQLHNSDHSHRNHHDCMHFQNRKTRTIFRHNLSNCHIIRWIDNPQRNRYNRQNHTSRHPCSSLLYHKCWVDSDGNAARFSHRKTVGKNHRHKSHRVCQHQQQAITAVQWSGSRHVWAQHTSCKPLRKSRTQNRR